MRHTYVNPRALDSCTLFAFSLVEDCHVLCIMATKYGRELVAYRNRFAGHAMGRKCPNKYGSTARGTHHYELFNLKHGARHTCYPRKDPLLSNPGSQCPTGGKFKFSLAFLQGTVIHRGTTRRLWCASVEDRSLAGSGLRTCTCQLCPNWNLDQPRLRICSPTLKQNACRPTTLGVSCI